MKHVIKKHKYKFMIGFPAVIALTIGLSARDTSILIATPTEGTFDVTVGETISTDIEMFAHEPMNVVSSLITFSHDVLEVQEIHTDRSVIDLWAEEPTYRNELGVIAFTGGIIREDGFSGEGSIMNITFKAKKSGSADVKFNNTALLAHDGRGSELRSSDENIRYFILEEDQPSPDFNKDGSIGMIDLNMLIGKTARAYDERYDLNQDSKVNLSDVQLLLSHW